MAVWHNCWLSMLALLAAAVQAAPVGRIAVVASSSAEAYREAVEGLKSGLAETEAHLWVIDLGDTAQRHSWGRTLQEAAPALVVAVGSDAIEALRSQQALAPVVVTMVLGKSVQAPGGRVAGAVTLDMPPALVLRLVSQVFPQSRRLGLLWNPQRSAQSLPELIAEAGRAGFALQTVEVPDPSRLLAALDALEGKADLVWCLPDETLYTPTTVKPLVMASLRKHLPLIGFSAGFARAGAVIGIYPDFREVGAQTAEMVKRYLGGESRLNVEAPRRLKAMVNLKIVRLLGVRARVGEEPAGSAVEFVR
jgi:ABC-type uncharacterized transport system substrate-binding protein